MTGARLQALASYQIVDTAREDVYDALVTVAAQMAGVRMAALSFIDDRREWFKSTCGFDRTQVDSRSSFGASVIDSDDVLEVADATRDDRLLSCELVIGEPNVRFYAGVPLRAPQGEAIGAFCVMSRIPRVLTAQQRNGLRELATAVMAALNARRQMLGLFTEGKAAQEQIALLLSAVNIAGDVILVYRVDSKSGELALTYMNDAYTRQTGYTREEAIGMPLRRFRHAMPDDPGMVKLREAVKRGRPAQLEIASYRKDGSSFWNEITMHPIRDESGEIGHWITIERDVTEAVEREAKLEDQQARLLLLTSAARQLFGVLDKRALVSSIEEAVRDLVGGTGAVHRIPDPPQQFEDPLLARAASMRGHVTDESRFRAAAAAASAGPARYVLEARARSGGTLRAADLFMLDLLAEYFGVAVHNASLLEELDERRSSILELNQVKTDLIAMLAHDFKSPLTSIVGFTELAMELGSINDDQRQYLESVKRIALRLADLASDTLAFSRMERNEIDLSLAQVDLVQLAQDVADSLADQRAVSLTSSGECVVAADGDRLRQVLYNLVENAIKYSPHGEPVEVNVRAVAGRVRITVTDHGIGIPKAEIDGIFGRFSRASNARKMQIAGSGFGLYVTRQIIEMHGGTISVDSVEGKGSTFAVYIPVLATLEGERPLRVVLAERERESRSFFAHALREAGFRVRVAHSGEELFDLIAQEPADRVLVDCDDIVVASEHMARLQELEERGELRVVPFNKPVLVQDLLSAIRSRPA